MSSLHAASSELLKTLLSAGRISIGRNDDVIAGSLSDLGMRTSLVSFHFAGRKPEGRKLRRDSPPPARRSEMFGGKLDEKCGRGELVWTRCCVSRYSAL